MAGRVGRCSFCNAQFQISPATAAQPAPGISVAPSPFPSIPTYQPPPNLDSPDALQPPTALNAQVGAPLVSVPASAPMNAADTSEVFPERMKANRALAGRSCSFCGRQIEIGDDVFNCSACRRTMHNQCFEAAKGCANQVCPKSAVKPVAAADTVQVDDGAEDDLVECKFCREKIRKEAKKCRYCGELQGAAARAAELRKKKKAEEDDTLTTGDIVFGVLCGGIACIVGLVWMIQGKKKGLKLMLLGIGSAVVWSVLRGLLGAS
jgi:hypothetical protein